MNVTLDLNGADVGLNVTLNYVEQQSATAIAPVAVVSDDTPDLNGGLLRVVQTFAAGTDQLSIGNVGTGPGQISVSGSTVFYEDIAIGTFAGGTAGNDLVISFTGTAATPAAVQALIRGIQYENGQGDNPSGIPRTFTYVVDDGYGGSASAVATVNVQRVNDPPVVTAGNTVNYTENQPAIVISPAASVTDPDAIWYAGGSLTVSLSANGTSTDQLIVGDIGSGPGQISVSGNTVSYQGTAFGTFTGGANGNDLVVTFFTTTAPIPAAVQALLQDIQFSTASASPSTAPRTVTFTVNDGGNTGGPPNLTGSDIATINIIDTTPPKIIGVTAAGSSPTNAGTVEYIVGFSEPVKGVDATGFGVAANGVTGAFIEAVTPVAGSGGAQYSVEINTGTGDGTVALQIGGAGITDLAGNALPGGKFASSQPVLAGANPTYIATGDLNGDGKADLAVTNGSSGISVLLGNGDGTFAPARTIATDPNPDGLVLADVNGDSKADMVFGHYINGGSISVMLGNGDGSFQNPINYATPPYPSQAVVADLNNDGKADLAITDNLITGVSVYLGNGDGTFQSEKFTPTGVSPVGIAVADLNGDHKLDLVAADHFSDYVSILLGNGDGTFQAAGSVAASGPEQVRLGDLNGDGKADLVIANYTSGSVSVALGNGDGTFAAPVGYNVDAGQIDIQLQDVNGDGALDIVVPNIGKDSLSVLLGNGNGTFQPAATYAAGAGATFVALADFNGDGRPDIAAADAGSNTISILQNVPSTPTISAYVIDKTAPALAVVLADDTGLSSNDKITSDPNLTGSGDPNATVHFTVDGNPISATAVADATGAWSFTPTGLSDGPHTMAASETDAAGNTGTASLTLTLDTAAHATIGPLTSDDVVNASEASSGFVIGGVTDADRILAVIRDVSGHDIAGLSLATISNGSWSYPDWYIQQYMSHLPDGTYNFGIYNDYNSAGNLVVRDIAGNVTTAWRSFTVDRTAPAVTTALADDTGSSLSDSITSDPNLTGSGDPNATVHFTVDGNPISATAVADATGAWSFTPTGLSDGPHTMAASETDAAGNTGTASLTLTLDTAAHATIGPLTSDDVVNASEASSGFVISGVTDADRILAVIRDVSGHDIAGLSLATISNGSWSYPDWYIQQYMSHLPDGTYNFGIYNDYDSAGNLVVRDIAGNVTTAWRSFTVDRTAPAVTTALADDTGSSLSDSITSDPSLSGSGDPNTVVHFTVDGNPISATAVADVTGAWSFTPIGLAEGQHTVVASETDAAGNTGTASLTLTLDTAAHATIGPLTSDDVVNASEASSGFVIGGVTDADRILAVIWDVSGHDIAGLSLATISNGSWSYPDWYIQQYMSHLPDGTYNFGIYNDYNSAGNLVVRDIAGNVTTAWRSFTVDRTAPAVTTALADDTGSSSSDSITSDPSLSGSGDPNAVVHFIVDGSVIASTATADASGTWSFIPTMADGSHTFVVSETDAAGNNGTSNPLTFALDTAAPAKPAAPVDASVSNGYINAAENTADQELTGTAEAGSTVAIYDWTTPTTLFETYPVTQSVANGWIANGFGQSNEYEPFSLGQISTVTSIDFVVRAFSTAPSFPADVDVTIYAAGSAPGQLGAALFSQDFSAAQLTTLFSDTTNFGVFGAEAQLPATTLAAGTYYVSFTSNGSALYPTLYPGVASSLYFVDGSPRGGTPTSMDFAINGYQAIGTTTADASGNWTYTIGNLADGSTHSYTIAATDAAGNTSSVSDALAFTVDTAAPVVTASLANDTGSSATDKITSNAAISGTADANAVVHFTVDGTAIAATATADANGAWTFTPTGLADGPHAVVASESDAAGNVGTSPAVTFTLDSHGPTGWQFTLANSNFDGAASIAAGTVIGSIAETGDTTSSPFTYFFASNAAGTSGVSQSSNGLSIDANTGNATATAALSSWPSVYVVAEDQAGNVYSQLLTLQFGTSAGQSIAVAAGATVTFGLGGNDTITGTSIADAIAGGAGNDLIIGFVGADTVNGGAGTDSIVLSATSGDLNTATDAQIVNVEAINAASAAIGVVIDLHSQSEGFTVTGSASDDTITGGVGADSIAAGGGNDQIIGFVGADTVNGGAGTDTIVLSETSTDLNTATNARITNIEAVSAASATAGVTIDLHNQSEGFTVTGSAFADLITGGGGAELDHWLCGCRHRQRRRWDGQHRPVGDVRGSEHGHGRPNCQC